MTAQIELRGLVRGPDWADELDVVGHPAPSPGSLDVSVVLPCLNEVASVGAVVREALTAIRRAGLRGEVVVADNGSGDGSQAAARAAGARVIDVPLRGYGSACHAGMMAGSGRVLVMADADATYPMDAIPAVVGPILAGEKDMVIGSRLRGRIEQRSMPWTHRYIGNPILTGALNRFFGLRLSDAHCGMRAVDAAAYRRLGLCTQGMEYASEMIVQAAHAQLRVSEVPIEYRSRVGESKLQTWPDGWRHLKFLLLASPTWLFFLPGVSLLLLGSLLVIPLAFGPAQIGPVHLIIHPIVIGAVMMVIGHQMLLFGVLTRACSPMRPGRLDRVAEFVHRRLKLERVLLLGGGLVMTALLIAGAVFVHWALSGFGALTETRQLIAAMVVFILGAQTIFGGFLYAFFLPDNYGGVARSVSREAEWLGVASVAPVAADSAAAVSR